MDPGSHSTLTPAQMPLNNERQPTAALESAREAGGRLRSALEEAHERYGPMEAAKKFCAAQGRRPMAGGNNESGVCGGLEAHKGGRWHHRNAHHAIISARSFLLFAVSAGFAAGILVAVVLLCCCRPSIEHAPFAACASSRDARIASAGRRMPRRP